MINSNVKKTLIAVAALVFIFGAIYSYNFLHEIVTTYFRPSDTHSYGPPDGFNDAKYFVEVGHGEIKSLAIQFLTLLTAMLMFSVTYSEKIIVYSDAGKPLKAAITTTWVFLVLAIVLDGIGLVCNAFALPFALQDMYIMSSREVDSNQFYGYAFRALYALVMSGFFFVISLIGIVTSGLMKLRTSKQEPVKVTVIDNQI